MGWAWEVSAWLVVALLVALTVSPWHARRVGIARAAMWEALLSVSGGAALGARLGALSPDAWGSLAVGEWRAVLVVLLGAALSMPGAVVGGALALALWARGGRQQGWAIGDAMTPGWLLAASVLWLAAYRLGLGYGLPARGVGMLLAPDSYGLVMARWPVQLISAAASAGLALVLLATQPRRPLPTGSATLLALWWTNLVAFVLGFVRGDPATFLGPFRLEQFAALAWMMAMLMALAWRWQSGQTKERPA